ncbi:hypothetical protein DVA67_025150 [Solirubrobacter sp. CPCC 204708]|uniref:Uncharacterized protein n=1 Tax=Solirubrobacter deserti TaxID=2282478 RepID=A0ABT4RRR9_9ACTN|nr:hypothetical protein [Solirubrobacter deserti]MBE2319289.1 hypothetical protein [Solirubrobacter deserti]MDA0141155.1 hypothetical protein [Solirubrobacter deserti]
MRWMVLTLFAVLVVPGSAQARLSVTFAARACPSYAAIAANLARNDIQESLQDLGPNTPYRSGQPIDPDVEANAQPQCRPLPDWRFTLGTNYRSRAISGPWGRCRSSRERSATRSSRASPCRS